MQHPTEKKEPRVPISRTVDMNLGLSRGFVRQIYHPVEVKTEGTFTTGGSRKAGAVLPSNMHAPKI